MTGQVARHIERLLWASKRSFVAPNLEVGSAPEAVIPPKRSSRDFVELDGFRRLVDRPAETGKAPAAADRPNRQLTM